MVRPSRIDVEGGWYQVVNRGIERRSIFKKQLSYAHFLELPSKMPERFELKVHRYVLMRNHSEFITDIMPVVRHPQHGSLRKRFLPECEMFSAPTASPVALGKAVPILADGVKVPLKFEKPIFTLRPASLHG